MDDLEIEEAAAKLTVQEVRDMPEQALLLIQALARVATRYYENRSLSLLLIEELQAAPAVKIRLVKNLRNDEQRFDRTVQEVDEFIERVTGKK